MFRNPRENAAFEPSKTILPSTGRPPTPPPLSVSTQSSPYFHQSGSPNLKKMSGLVSPIPVLGRLPSKPASGKKNVSRPNQSILSFFGKTEKKAVEETIVENDLFFDNGGDHSQSSPIKSVFPAGQVAASKEEDLFRFNEDTTPIKKRKIDQSETEDFLRTPSPDRMFTSPDKASVGQIPGARSKVRISRGGFVEDSSDDEDVSSPKLRSVPESLEALPRDGSMDEPTQFTGSNSGQQVDRTTITTLPLKPPDESEVDSLRDRRSLRSDNNVPSLSRENTSMMPPEDFGDIDFEDDEFYEEGEEFLERRWMEEQLEMEIGLEDDSKSESGTDNIVTPGVEDEIDQQCTPDENISTCPICNGNMKGLSESEASGHVNACLDGTAPPLPSPADTHRAGVKLEERSAPQFSTSVKRFQRAAIARPGQANPFATAAGPKAGGSAFSKLMSGHAEDAAWAEAAANEAQSRGKPAYQRTCPFYKIMPGLYICVDAFRYGKVEGQNAYFLSHFHSDHYIGLTAQWCHGPIYASKVTCNLMRQQLKVDSKWLRPLEFEKKVEVPDTGGVHVTMIPANHCPGSSLYLFEKVIGKNKDGSPKLNRILHCGDFRACPAHVNHPLLMPEVMDAVTGQTKQQVIDTCYLDTTYLTPKFSFPCQSDVIDACAKMCVSLAKDIVDSSDSWEKVKLAKAGSTMKKFLEDGKQEIVKREEEVEDKKPTVRGRLLVVIGTYSIGKERICLGIARALNSKIYAPPSKMRICKALEDPDLNSLLTSDPLEAQVHMQMLMEIRADTLHDYLITFRGHFHRVVGFRPTGWTYRPPTSRLTVNPAVSTVLHSDGWKSRFTMHDLAPQRGSTKESNCFGVPYSEHSSFRELTMFCCALRINRVIPTVNVGSSKSRERMKAWIEKWDTEKKKNGLFKIEVGAEGWGSGDGQLRYGV